MAMNNYMFCLNEMKSVSNINSVFKVVQDGSITRHNSSYPVKKFSPLGVMLLPFFAGKVMMANAKDVVVLGTSYCWSLACVVQEAI
jgi:hypothetical protein